MTALQGAVIMIYLSIVPMVNWRNTGHEEFQPLQFILYYNTPELFNNPLLIK